MMMNKYTISFLASISNQSIHRRHQISKVENVLESKFDQLLQLLRKINISVKVHFDGSRNCSIIKDQDFYTKNWPLYDVKLMSSSLKLWIKTYGPYL